MPIVLPFLLILKLLCLSHLFGEDNQISAQQVQVVEFTTPAGWRYADIQKQLKNVHMMVVGQGKHELPPSLTLGTDHFQGTSKEYLKRIRTISESNGGEWKDLGMIKTEAGEANFLQEDIKTQWGNLRMMYVILMKNGTAYILTAAALKDEFSTFYPEFFRAMRSLRFRNETSASEQVTDSSSK